MTIDLFARADKCLHQVKVIGRMAWWFSDAPAGVHSSALIDAFLQTTKANGLEPNTWLRRVLPNLTAPKTVEALEALLPWNLRITDSVETTAQ